METSLYQYWQNFAQHRQYHLDVRVRIYGTSIVHAENRAICGAVQQTRDDSIGGPLPIHRNGCPHHAHQVEPLLSFAQSEPSHTKGRAEKSRTNAGDTFD